MLNLASGQGNQDTRPTNLLEKTFLFYFFYRLRWKAEFFLTAELHELNSN